MTQATQCERLVVVHGAADPILTYTLDLVGLEIVSEIGEITIWAPCPLKSSSWDGLPPRRRDWPLA